MLYMSLRLLGGWTNREGAVLRRSKGALDTLLPVERIRDWNTIRTGRHFCMSLEWLWKAKKCCQKKITEKVASSPWICSHLSLYIYVCNLIHSFLFLKCKRPVILNTNVFSSYYCLKILNELKFANFLIFSNSLSLS